MNLEVCTKIVNELITQIDGIISKGAKLKDTKSLDKFRDVSAQLKQLIRTLYPDAEVRLQDYKKSITRGAERDGAKKTRTSFLEQAKATRRYLFSIKDTLRLREAVEIKENKLDKLKEKVEEKEIESERREKVTEAKFYGAAIEMIDRLRDQLKNEGDIKQEILNIKNELKSIKETLNNLVVNSESSR